ncbi:hypothetical protein CLV33_101441 [Jejuia pallidilutea]|uniref:Uncharacterized protein n=1 Tax=Jejuia pallidilutea TaxID=504487 RepID=A0A362X452_9FLAO|nr:hypothetical protein [Jejuia pallidilutea]PQV51517.1 hypothetical protein CLV33_101441 [Jejuia pallidilutea]
MTKVNRRKFIKTTASASAAFTLLPYSCKIIESPFSNKNLNLKEVRNTIGRHLNHILDKDGPYGSYRIGLKQRPDLYSSCDVAQIRTIWGEDLHQSLSEKQRTEWADHINSYIQKHQWDGSYFDRLGHSPLHGNGMTIGALGVLGGKQALPVKLYDKFNSPEKVISWLENINWARQWSASHLFWGGIHCYSMSKHCTEDWLNTVFDWLDRNLDEKTGWWRKGIAHDDIHQALGGSAHILPIYQHKNREFPFPERVIDSVLAMQLPNKRWLQREGNPDLMHYLELDALYALKYMQELVPYYRKSDIEHSVYKYGLEVIKYWKNEQEALLAMHPHRLLSAVAIFGLLQYHLPEMFYDDRQWTDIFSDIRFYRTDLVERL